MLTGFFALTLLMSNIGPVFHNLFERSFDAVPVLLEALTPVGGATNPGP
jgi:hypothetical protein